MRGPLPYSLAKVAGAIAAATSLFKALTAALTTLNPSWRSAVDVALG